MTPLFQFSIVLKTDDEKWRSAPIIGDKSPDEIIAAIEAAMKGDKGEITMNEVMVLAWLFDCYFNENCACAGCFESWLEEQNLNDRVMFGVMAKLTDDGWVNIVNLRKEVPN